MSEHPVDPHFIANHLGLDFINTAFGTGAERRDCLASDRSVLDWLAQAGVLPDGVDRAPRGIAAQARALREEARTLVAAAQAGHAADMRTLNGVLDAGQPVRRLVWDDARARPLPASRPRGRDAASLLYPVADAIAQLLAESDLRHVRTCEAHDCSLVFLDTTKSHRRRWCSMAVCGNRMKAAAFRLRRSAG
ncbi:ABATE domain-containing protein [Luteimonas sp. FCS-9]|uniref:CGNR zinc finger domain-containing protein n=1 Tax=Luteimonas sp. FCS-9 TaxID=1547516 RepID=UPI00063E8185|nr:ABATE domain-containing protein [Luteimonas sp. FCS-9]KLJ00803.1 hypothetical protein WQ56_08480 [Luteimonas sp. FCS-9]